MQKISRFCLAIPYVIRLTAMRRSAPPLIGFIIIVLFAGASFADAYSDLLREARTAFRAGKFDETISKVREIESLGLDRGIEMAYFLAGQAYAKGGDSTAALKYFEGAASNPDFILSDYSRFAAARSLEKLGNGSSAEAMYEKLIIEEPNSALSSKCILSLAKANAAKGNRKGAIELYDLIIYSPDEEQLAGEARYFKAKSLEAEGQWKEAAETYYYLTFYNPQSPYAGEAKKSLKAIVKRTRIPSPYASREEVFKRAMLYYDRSDFPSASAELYRFLKSYPTGYLSEGARLRLGMSEYKRRKFKTAYYHLKIVADSKMDGADEAQFYLSFIYAGWGRFNNTIASLQKVTWNYPDSEYADDAAFYIGYFYDTNGFKARGMKEYAAFLANHPKSDFTSDALWRIGKFYYGNKDYESAYITFKRAEVEFSPSKLTSNCIYWSAMSALKLERRDDAKTLFLKIVKGYDHSYFSYRAREKLRYLGVSDDEIKYAEAGIPGDNYSDDIELSSLENVQDESEGETHKKKYYALLYLGLYDDAQREALYLADNSQDEEKAQARILYFFAKHKSGNLREALLFAEGKYFDAISDGKISETDFKVWQLAYPRGFWNYVLRYSVQYDIDPYLVLAVIREESRFNSMTVSWARAHGLMQIIPSTGRGIARLIGIRPYYTLKLFDPETNIKMGCYYLSNLMKRFDGNPYLAAAAYNGGPMRVKAWLNKWGREKAYELDIDEFVEGIPLGETRRYVQKVMHSFNEYKRIYERSSKSQGNEG